MLSVLCLESQGYCRKIASSFGRTCLEVPLLLSKVLLLRVNEGSIIIMTLHSSDTEILERRHHSHIQNCTRKTIAETNEGGISVKNSVKND